MTAKPETHPPTTRNQTTVDRRSDCEIAISRSFNAPARLVFDAWTKPDLIRRWWAPKSSGLVLISCETDVRVGGAYRYEFGRDGSLLMAFFGHYTDVTPGSRLVWTNEESAEGAISTLTLTETAGKTLLVLSEVYPTKAALDASIEGMEGGMPEQFGQLDDLLDAM